MSHYVIYKRKNGFTLVEMVLYISTISILIMSISLFIPTIVESRLKSETISEVNQQGLLVMQIITQSVRNAIAINTPSSNTSETLLLDESSPDEISFRLVSGVLEMSEADEVYTPLTNQRVTVSGLSFNNLSASSTSGVVRIQFTVTSNNVSGKNYYDFHKTFYGSATVKH